MGVSLFCFLSVLLFNFIMKTIEEIRTENLNSLIDKHGGNTKFALKIDKEQAQISQWAKNAPDSRTKKPRVINSESCRNIEKTLNIETGWMDNDHSKKTSIQNGHPWPFDIPYEDFALLLKDKSEKSTIKNIEDIMLGAVNRIKADRSRLAKSAAKA